MEEVEERVPAEQTPTDTPPTGTPGDISPAKVIGMVVVAIVMVIIIIALVYGAATHPYLTAVVRDISIITLALVTMITSIFLAILIFQLQSLIVLLRDEVQPILESVNETAGTVRGTTTFVSDAMVSPMIRVASYASGVRQTVRTLTSISRTGGGSENKPKTK